MYTIRKKFSFSAAHQLHGLIEGHPCGRLHGHNYEVEVVLSDINLNEHDFVLDYRELDLFKQMLDTELDHRNLNDIFNFHTTAENLAKYFFEWCLKRWVDTWMVRVSETPKTWAEYTQHGI